MAPHFTEHLRVWELIGAKVRDMHSDSNKAASFKSGSSIVLDEFLKHGKVNLAKRPEPRFTSASPFTAFLLYMYSSKRKKKQ